MGEENTLVTSSSTVAELKAMCKENGLSVAGKKAELIDRLNSHFSEESISLEEEIEISLEEDVEQVKEVSSVPLPSVNDKIDNIIDGDVVISGEGHQSLSTSFFESTPIQTLFLESSFSLQESMSYFHILY
mgnify:CR=1 FL=1